MALDIKETEPLLNNENRWDRKRLILQLAISYRKSNQNFSTTHYIFPEWFADVTVHVF